MEQAHTAHLVQVYVAVKFHPDRRNRGLVDQISDAFASCGVESVCVARDIERWGEKAFQPDELMAASFDAIDNSSAVVVEFSEEGVGLGIEAGYASARGIPVFVIHQSGADVSTTLRGVAQEVFEYTDTDSLVDAARRITTDPPTTKRPATRNTECEHLIRSATSQTSPLGWACAGPHPNVDLAYAHEREGVRPMGRTEGHAHRITCHIEVDDGLVRTDR